MFEFSESASAARLCFVTIWDDVVRLLWHLYYKLNTVTLIRETIVSVSVIRIFKSCTKNLQVIKLGGPGSKTEIEQNMLHGKLAAVTAYFGELVYDDDVEMEESEEEGTN